MIYLALAILSASSIGLLFKYSENRGMHRYTITAVNYLTASCIALVISMRADLVSRLSLVSGTGLLKRVAAITLDGGMLPPGNSVLWAVLIGIMTGFFFLNAFIYFQRSIFENGIALSSMFARLGVLIPMTVSIIIWQEIPSSIQNVGIALAIAAIVLVNLEFEKNRTLVLRSTLLLLFIFSGAGIFCNKLFQKYALLEFKGLFLLFAFSTAFLFALRVCAQKKQTLTLPDLGIGMAVGSCNLLTNYFLIMALSQMKAAIVFPISSAGAIITMTLGGVILFRERLHLKDMLAMTMTLIAIILINM
ncbi:MAG: EamA family transporter [bacterium]